MNQLRSHGRDWEDLGTLDPLWAIATSDAHRYAAWDVEGFLGAGRRKAEKVLTRLERLGLPTGRKRALDFGCGVGRLTLAFAEHFDEVVGVDIAPAMLARARQLAAEATNVSYVHNDLPDLDAVPAGPFDLVYTELVLQHLPSQELIRRAVRALAARVGPGGALVLGVPVALAPRVRLQPRRRAYALLRRLGVPRRFLYERLGLQPMRMTAVGRDVLEADVRAAGLVIVAAHERERDGVRSVTLYATRR